MIHEMGTLRKPGRPQRQSGDVGRKHLVAAAKSVLSTVEPSRVTRQMVAENAGVDPNLIRYYFGNMRRLIVEVIADTHRGLGADMSARQEEEPLKRLHYRIERIFKLFQDHPHHHKMVTMTLCEDHASDEHREWLSNLDGALAELDEIIDQGVEQGLMRWVDPRFLHMTIIAAGEFLATNQPLVRILFGPDATAQQMNRAFVTFLYDMVVYGLASRRDRDESAEPNRETA